LLLPTSQVNPRFFRVHFWTVLGLLVVPAVFAPPGVSAGWWLALAAGLGLAFLGSLVWSLEGAAGGRLVILLTTLDTALALAWMAWQAARIRSTQSVTGILYVVVIFCFLGELTNQLLLAAPAVPSLESAVFLS